MDCPKTEKLVTDTTPFSLPSYTTSQNHEIIFNSVRKGLVFLIERLKTATYQFQHIDVLCVPQELVLTREMESTDPTAGGSPRRNKLEDLKVGEI